MNNATTMKLNKVAATMGLTLSTDEMALTIESIAYRVDRDPELSFQAAAEGAIWDVTHPETGAWRR